MKMYIAHKDDGYFMGEVEVASADVYTTPHILTTKKPSTFEDFLDEDGVWHTPSGGYAGAVFNYATRSWESRCSIEEYRASAWEKVKTQRDSLEFGGFEYKGRVYDSDQVSQGRIMGAAIAGVDQVWTLADNTTVELSASELQQLYAALQAHIANVHERGRTARQLINEAETREEVEAVQL